MLAWILKGKNVSCRIDENVDQDIACCLSLEAYKPDLFAKGSDTWNERNLPERNACWELGMKVVFTIGDFDKLWSSSQIRDYG